MRKQLYWLSEQEWRRIEPLLPRGRRGAHRVDDRRVISGIIYMLRTGARWRDCPPEYGPYTTIYNRFNRWTGDLASDVQGSDRKRSTVRVPRLIAPM
jgi:transposase